MGIVVPFKLDQNNNFNFEVSIISNRKSDSDASFESSFELKNNEKKYVWFGSDQATVGGDEARY